AAQQPSAQELELLVQQRRHRRGGGQGGGGRRQPARQLQRPDDRVGHHPGAEGEELQRQVQRRQRRQRLAARRGDLAKPHPPQRQRDDRQQPGQQPLRLAPPAPRPAQRRAAARARRRP